MFGEARQGQRIDNPFHLRSPKRLPQVVLGVFENAPLFLRQVFPGAIDVEIQHRHRGLIRRALATCTQLSGAFQRERDLARIFCFEDIGLEIKRVAALRYFRGPSAATSL